MNKILIVVALVIVLAGGWFLMNKDTVPAEESMEIPEMAERTETEVSDEKMVVTEGVYVVNADASNVNWAGKKPFIEGYTNTGSFSLKDGSINVADETATGNFTIDMNTLSVSKTPTKPGQESKLEEHLMGERWFDVAQFPEASFAINEVTPRADSDTTLIYDVRGNLTLKGQTHEVIFPADIYLGSDGKLHAMASFEFDRTKWGITSGSGSFFDDLADNVVDDMVALTFHLVADKQ